MKKIILIISLVFISINSYSKSFNANLKGDEVNKFYWKYINKATDEQIILIPKGTLYCKTKKGLKEGYKAALANNYARLRRLGCGGVKIATTGLVTEMTDGSDIVRVAYRLSGNHKGIEQMYFIWSTLYTQADQNRIELK